MNHTLLALHDVSLKFPGAVKNSLTAIDFSIQTGDFVIVLGSNGSGKSSLLKCLTNTNRPSVGKITLRQQSLAQFTAKKLSRRIKFLGQNSQDTLFMSLTVFENYLIVKHAHSHSFFHSKQTIARQIFQDYIVKFNDNLTLKLDQPVASLSGGEQQALALALTVLYPPEILLLDEHTSALDPLTADKLMLLTAQTIVDKNITCLMTTHDLAIAKTYGNRILALKEGRVHRIIEREANNIITQQELLAACY